MQNVVPKGGPRAPLFFSVATSLLFLTRVAAPQSVDLSLLEHCASLDAPDRKLACFEAIVSSGDSSTVDIPDAAPAAIADTAPEAGSGIARLPAQETTAARIPQPESDPDPVPAARVASEIAPAVDVESASPSNEVISKVTETPETTMDSPDPADSALPAAEIGTEHLPDRNRNKDQTVTATVVEVRQGYNRTLSFHMANGQVWRQIEARRLQYPKNEEFEVFISQGMLGEYRLRIGENGRLVKIRRIQ